MPLKAKKNNAIQCKLTILRRASGEAEPYWQTIAYQTEDPAETVASALQRINAAPFGTYHDVEGRPVEEIRWECSCLQKKCGACAMVIAGRPALACNCFLKDYRREITVEPLRKFPVLADLIVDRSILYRNLRQLQLWFTQQTGYAEQNQTLAYEASRCLQCGCCLEVCPNFCPEGDFFGAAAFVPTTRLFASLSEEDQARVRQLYLNHVYHHCGKALSCKKVCPAGIDTEAMLLHANGRTAHRR